MLAVRTKEPRFISIDARIAQAYSEYKVLMVAAEHTPCVLKQAEEKMEVINVLLDHRLWMRNHK